LVGLWEARLCLARRDCAGAAAWAETCGLSPEDEPRFLDELGHLTLAQVLLDLGRPNEAGRLLERLRQAADSAGRQGRLIHILIVQALVQQASGDEAGALIRLEQSLVLAEAEGYVRTFVDEGEPVRSLLVRYRAQLTQKSQAVNPADSRVLAYVDKLLSAFPSPALEKAKAPPSTALVPSALADPLTTRELQVLQLLAAGLSNKEIADRLVVSVGTVKAHSSSIYRKLDVPGRTRAVAMAREIRLI